MGAYGNVLDLIGNTPLVRLRNFDTGGCELYAKLESQNPGGSIKDRIGDARCVLYRSIFESGESTGARNVDGAGDLGPDEASDRRGRVRRWYGWHVDRDWTVHATHRPARADDPCRSEGFGARRCR